MKDILLVKLCNQFTSKKYSNGPFILNVKFSAFEHLAYIHVKKYIM